MQPIFSVEQRTRDTLAVVRTFDGERNTVHMTSSYIEAYRMRDELEKTDARAFYEGLLIGRAEGEYLATKATVRRVA